MIKTGQELLEIFGNNIKTNRKRIDLTQEKLSEIVNVSKNAISKIERGKGFAKAETIAKLAEAFNLEIYELFKTEDILPDKPESALYKYSEKVINAMEVIRDDYIKKIKK